MVDDAGASSSEVVDELLGTYSNEERQQGHGEGRGTPSGERFRRENHLGQGGGLGLATRGRIAQKPEPPEALDFTQQGRRCTPCDESSPSLNLCRYICWHKRGFSRTAPAPTNLRRQVSFFSSYTVADTKPHFLVSTATKFHLPVPSTSATCGDGISSLPRKPHGARGSRSSQIHPTTTLQPKNQPTALSPAM